MSLTNKNILITAGPTWVNIDGVRVISNIASGQTGIMLAEAFQKSGAKVTLVVGQINSVDFSPKVKVIRFKFFEELQDIIYREVSTRKYHYLIHSAAVSDYGVSGEFKKKISSGRNELKLKLIPLPKIIDNIKKLDPKVILVGFKFEPKANTLNLIKEARKLIKRSGADLIVANSEKNDRYSALLVSNNEVSIVTRSKSAMVNKLLDSLFTLECVN